MPLSGLRVLELSTILAGPAVGLFFAEMGAEVIKVENPRTGGDPTRGWRLPQENTSDDRSAYFCSVNWGKRSLALDLKDEADRGQLRALLPGTDVLLVNFKPGDDVKLGLSLKELRRQFPELLIGAINGYGQDSSRPGFDALVQAESGFMFMNGPSGGPACKLPVALIDLLAAHQLKEGLLLALLERERGRGGKLVTVSLWETALASLINQATNVLMVGHEPQPAGTEHPNLFPYGTLVDCCDGQVLLAVGTDRQFAALCQVLELPALARQATTNQQRNAAREQLRAELNAAAARFVADDLLRRLAEVDVPSGRLASVSQALSRADEALKLVANGVAGLRGNVFTGFARRRLSPPPRLGQHTQEILAATQGEPVR